MSLAIYKPGQGYWTRMLTAVGAGMILLSGAAWLWRELTRFNQLYLQAGVVIGLLLVVAGVLFYVLNKPRVVDFMIATEAEMRKVNWPSWREIWGSTWIVICGTLLMALILFVVDLAFTKIFIETGVLQQ